MGKGLGTLEHQGRGGASAWDDRKDLTRETDGLVRTLHTGYLIWVEGPWRRFRERL